jgi:hypothetical protein
MFNSVKSIALATSVSLAALTTAAYAAEPVAFSNVDVEASMSAAENSNALDAFPEIVTDLQTAIASRIQTSDDAADPTISIDVRKIALNGNPMLTDDNAFNQMEGVVSITDTNNDVGAQSFAVNVSASTPDQVIPEGYVAIAPSEGDFYAAMIDGFADVVAEQAANLYTDGVDREK